MTDVQLSYREFIDDMARVARSSVSADRLAAHGHTERTNVPARGLEVDEARRRVFCEGVPADQKGTLAQLLCEERVSAVHDVLAHLEWAVATRRLDLSGAGGSFAGQAEETMHGDYIALLSHEG